jgi:uncharacterized short protein YbdD (DUF466 family)
MNGTGTDEDSAAPAGAAVPEERSMSRSPLRDRLRAVRQGYLQVVGIPDYERYVAHATSHHPGEPVLSRREFFRQAIDRKYGRSGPRCC